MQCINIKYKNIKCIRKAKRKRNILRESAHKYTAKYKFLSISQLLADHQNTHIHTLRTIIKSQDM